MMLRALLSFSVALLAACALPEKLAPYKVEIQQGNFLPPDAIAKLKTGMTKEQVRFLLGTPVIENLFHANRWHYISRTQKGDRPAEQRNLRLYFEQNKLARFESDFEQPQPVAVAATKPPAERKRTAEPTPATVPAAAGTESKPAAAAAPAPAIAVRQPEPARLSLQLAVPQYEVNQSLTARPAVVSDDERVMQTVQAWVRAWAGQDVEAYLAFYAKNFRTPGGESRNRWEQTRRRRVSGPKRIEIRVTSLRVTRAGSDWAAAVFRQDYQSNLYRDSVLKELTFVKESGSWRIQQERTVKARAVPQVE